MRKQIDKIKDKTDQLLTKAVKDDAIIQLKNRLFDEGLVRSDLSDDEYEILLEEAIKKAKKDYLKKGAFTAALAGLGLSILGG